MVPDGWAQDTLGGILDVSSGKRPELTADGAFPVYGGNGVMGYTDEPLVNGPTIVIGRVGSPGTVHPVGEPCWVSDNALYVTNLADGADWDFTSVAMTFARLGQYATRSSHPSLSQKALTATPVLLPPLPEQRKIATILSSVDDAIAATRKVIDQTERVKQGFLQALMTRGIGHTRFKQTEVGEIPEEWEVVTLTDVARLESGHTPARNRDDYWGGDIAWVSLQDTERLRAREIHETEFSVTPLGIANSSARVLPKGTVALSRTATVGRCSLLGRDMATSQDFANYTCGPRLFNRYLLHRFRWMKPVWERLSAGSTHKTVYMPDFKRLKIALPLLDEQRQIATIVDTADDVLERRQLHVTHLQSLKRGLLQDLLTGRVRVTPD